MVSSLMFYPKKPRLQWTALRQHYQRVTMTDLQGWFYQEAI